MNFIHFIKNKCGLKCNKDFARNLFVTINCRKICKLLKLVENISFSIIAYITVMIFNYLNCTDAVSVVLSFDNAYLLNILEGN